MQEKSIYYNGQWQETKDVREIINPATGEKIMYAAEANAEEAKAAIYAARNAFDSGIWSEMPVAARAELMMKAADLLEENGEYIDKLEADNTGKLYHHSIGEAAGAAKIMRSYASLVSSVKGDTYTPGGDLFVLTVRQPIGVCAAIIPWNYPLFTTMVSIAPALAAGNTVVLKPASLTPCSAVVLIRIFEEAGFPPGVINLITGSGEVIGDTVAESPDVDLIVLTGGTDTGRRVMSKASENIKRLELELGGKSPAIVFDDFDTDIAAENIVTGILMNQGQLCTACSRMIVQDTIYEEMIRKVAEYFNRVKFGYGPDKEANQCTLISQKHLEQVMEYIEKGKDEGARLVCGGYRVIDGELSKGFYIAPTILADCTSDMTVVQQEIFGPVLAVQKFHTLDEAIHLANDTIFGLAGGVFTNDFSKAQQVIKRLRCGLVFVNNYLNTIGEAPISAAKQSGIGTIGGLRGLESFMQTKQIAIRFNPEQMGLF